MRLLCAIAVVFAQTAVLLVLLQVGVAHAQPAIERLIEPTLGIVSYDAENRENDKGQTFSVGILIDETHAITSLHSCCRPREGAKRLGFAGLVNKETAVPAEVIWSSAEKDIVILKLARPVSKRPASLYPLNFLRDADRLFALHYTGVEGKEFKTQIVPVIAGGVTNWQSSKAIKTDLAPYENNDGAPLFTGCGAVAGFRVNSSEPGGLAIVASEIQAAAEAAGIKILVESEVCNIKALGNPYAPPAPPKNDPAKDRTPEASKSPFETRTWIAIVAGVVVLVFVLIRQRSPTGIPKSKGPVLTSNLPPLPGGRPYFPPATPQYVGTPHAFLTGVSGEYLGLRLDLGARPIVIGRDPKGANLVLTNETVSSLHCAVSYDPGRRVFVLQDLGSANGTHLSTGQRIAPNSLLDIAPGTQFSVGDLSNRFQVTTEYPR
jgi:hypothetical protein